MHLENMSNMENIFLKRKNKKLFKSLFENDLENIFTWTKNMMFDKIYKILLQI